jgi:micrococcal nuclease
MIKKTLGLTLMTSLFTILLILLRFTSGGSVTRKVLSLETSSTPAVGRNLVRVIRVVDGDTFVIEGGIHVRLIGINSPELPNQCFSREALEKAQSILVGSYVYLEKDISENDRYGRLLRYVYKNNELVNETMVRGGYAYSIAYPPDTKNQKLFLAAQDEAKSAKRGIWGKCKINTP